MSKIIDAKDIRADVSGPAPPADVMADIVLSMTLSLRPRRGFRFRTS
jgi:hypothetical protein